MAVSFVQAGGNVRLVRFTSVQHYVRLCASLQIKHTHMLMRPFVRNRQASHCHVPDKQQVNLSLSVYCIYVCVHVISRSDTKTLVAHQSSMACPTSSSYGQREAVLIQHALN